MKLTPLQEKALECMLRPEERVTAIGGYAGTGKTTVLAEARKRERFDVLTPTHKAADVLRRKGVAEARTLHSVLYSMSELNVYEMPDGQELSVFSDEPQPTDGKLRRVELVSSVRENTSQGSRRALVDEGSMLKQSELGDLLEIYDEVVILGDAFQLPPVKSADLFETFTPAVFLDEVHRTALDNPIIRYATDLRSGRVPTPDGEAVKVIDSRTPNLFPRLIATDVQAIVWTNQLRRFVNDQMRAAMKLEANRVLQGERLICLSNIKDPDSQGLLAYNGQEMIATADAAPGREFQKTEALKFGDLTLRSWPFWMRGYWKFRDQPEWYSQVKDVWPRGNEFDYAYALTAHKSQGSEWDNVAVWDQSQQQASVMGAKSAARWKYTAVTRAKEKVLLIK